MDILSGGIWFPVVILVGISPVIIRNAEHIATCVCVCFPLVVWGKSTCCSWLLESWLCLEFIYAIPVTGPFLRDSCQSQALGLVNRSGDAKKYRLLASCSYRKWPQGSSTSSYQLWNNQSFRNSWLPGLCIREGCGWANTQSLNITTSSP